MLSWTVGQAFQGVYPYPVHHPYDRYSMVDLDAVDAEEWPEFGSVRGCVCILEPGDLLFVPQFWCVPPPGVCTFYRLHSAAWQLKLLNIWRALDNTGEQGVANAFRRFAHVHFLDQDNTDLTFYLHPGMLCTFILLQ